MDLKEFLMYLVGGGGFVVVNFAISWALEGTQWWADLSSKTKSITILGVAVCVGLGAQWLLLNAQIIDVIAPYAGAVIAIVSAWLTLQTAHAKNPMRNF